MLCTYDPKVTKVSGVELRGGWGIRGIAYWQGRVYTATHDGRLIALDAKTGKVIWSVQTLTKGDGRYITGAPLVYNGKVLIGRGGGMVWNAMVYDPELNRVYIGTGNGQPWNQKIRSPGGGDNLFTDAIVALDADTGAYVWHYQVNPGETWDYDATLDIELATLKIDGKERPVLMQASKNAFFYIIDRKTGKLLSANQYAEQNWAKYIDLKTGRPVVNPAARLPHDNPATVIPGPEGAHRRTARSRDTHISRACSSAPI